MRSPEDAVVLAGEDVVLYCSVENLPLDSLVQWTKGSFGLGYDKVLSGLIDNSLLQALCINRRFRRIPTILDNRRRVNRRI